jgi:hypothetical protein
MMEILRFKAPPVKMFFKFFYVFSIICSVTLLRQYADQFFVFVCLFYCVFSVLGLIANIFSLSFSEKALSKWCSVFLGLAIANSLKNLAMHLQGNYDFLFPDFFLLILAFMTTLFRYIYLKIEIADFLAMRKGRELLLKEGNGDG